jgi:hypothetical protein
MKLRTDKKSKNKSTEPEIENPLEKALENKICNGNEAQDKEVGSSSNEVKYII